MNLIENMLQTPEAVFRIFNRDAADDAMDLVIFRQKQFGEI